MADKEKVLTANIKDKGFLKLLQKNKSIEKLLRDMNRKYTKEEMAVNMKHA